MEDISIKVQLQLQADFLKYEDTHITRKFIFYTFNTIHVPNLHFEIEQAIMDGQTFNGEFSWDPSFDKGAIRDGTTWDKTILKHIFRILYKTRHIMMSSERYGIKILGSVKPSNTQNDFWLPNARQPRLVKAILVPHGGTGLEIMRALWVMVNFPWTYTCTSSWHNSIPLTRLSLRILGHTYKHTYPFKHIHVHKYTFSNTCTHIHP